MFSPAILHPNELDNPSYYRIRRDPAFARTFSIRKMGTHTRLPASSFAHSDNTSLKHGGGITAPDFEPILSAGLIIGAGNFVTSVKKTLVLDNGKPSGFCDSPAASTKILNPNALLLFQLHQERA
jgi:hypothetical protein